MKRICEEKSVTFLVPIIDVRTRWNSTYDMLVRAVSMKDVISDTIYGHKDNRLIGMLLSDEDWDCINVLLKILKPLKQVTLFSSRNSDSLCVVDVIPLYNYCTEMLTEYLGDIDANSDLHSGVESAVEKLTHYYDKISPMVGVALILNPTMKKDSLKDFLGWNQEWVDSAMEHFTCAFNHYKSKSALSHEFQIPILEVVKSDLGDFAEYMRKRKRRSNSSDTIESEFVR